MKSFLRVGAYAALLGCIAFAPPARALDLETALAEAAAANPGLAARRAQVDAARHRIGPAGAWMNPMLELGVMDVPVSNRYGIDAMTMKMIGVRQTVPLSGAHGLHRRAAVAAAESEAADAEVQHWLVLGATWEAYADAYRAGERAAHAQSHVGLMDRLVQSARARYGSGQGRLEEVLRAEAERAHTIGDLATFRAEERAARARLDALRGLPPGTTNGPLAEPVVTEPVAVVAAAPAPANAVLADVRSVSVAPDHPRLRALDAQAEQYRDAARAARRALWPELELMYSYGRRVDKITGGSAHGLPLADATLEDMYSASVGFELPVFAIQRERAQGREMDARARAARAERQAAELDLASQAAGARFEAEAAARVVALLADTVVATQRRAHEASMSAYTAGTTDLWRALESAHSLYDETLALTRARQELDRARARLLATTARGDLAGVRVPEYRGTER